MKKNILFSILVVSVLIISACSSTSTETTTQTTTQTTVSDSSSSQTTTATIAESDVSISLLYDEEFDITHSNGETTRCKIQLPQIDSQCSGAAQINNTIQNDYLYYVEAMLDIKDTLGYFSFDTIEYDVTTTNKNILSIRVIATGEDYTTSSSYHYDIASDKVLTVEEFIEALGYDLEKAKLALETQTARALDAINIGKEDIGMLIPKRASTLHDLSDLDRLAIYPDEDGGLLAMVYMSAYEVAHTAEVSFDPDENQGTGQALHTSLECFSFDVLEDGTVKISIDYNHVPQNIKSRDDLDENNMLSLWISPYFIEKTEYSISGCYGKYTDIYAVNIALCDIPDYGAIDIYGSYNDDDTNTYHHGGYVYQFDTTYESYAFNPYLFLVREDGLVDYVNISLGLDAIGFGNYDVTNFEPYSEGSPYGTVDTVDNGAEKLDELVCGGTLYPCEDVVSIETVDTEDGATAVYGITKTGERFDLISCIDQSIPMGDQWFMDLLGGTTVDGLFVAFDAAAAEIISNNTTDDYAVEGNLHYLGMDSRGLLWCYQNFNVGGDGESYGVDGTIATTISIRPQELGHHLRYINGVNYLRLPIDECVSIS